MYNKIIVILFVLFLFFFLSSEKLAAARVVRVAIHESKPLSFTGADGNILGIYPEVLEEIARLENWQLEWVTVSWLDGLRKVEQGEVELLGPIAFTQKRKERFNFNEETLFVEWGQVYLPENSKIETITDLSAKRVAVQRGNIMLKTLKELLDRFDITCQIIPTNDQSQVFDMISKGKVDAGAVNRLFGLLNEKEFNVQRSSIVYHPVELRFAAPKKGSEEILNLLDKNLRKLKQTKGSSYHRILDGWLFGEIDKRQGISLKRLFFILGIVACVFLFLFVWMQILKNQVRKRTSELRESEEKHRRLIQNALVGTYQVTKEGRFIMANRKMAEIFGYESEEAFLTNVDDITNLYANPEERSEILKEIDEKGFVADKEVEFRKKDGSSIWAKLFTTLFRDKEDTIYEGLMQDITKHKILETKIQQTQKMEAIGTLAGGIAHDFNNILFSITGYSELAIDDIGNKALLRDSLQEIATAGKRAKDLVQQILTFSRQADQELRPVQLKLITKEVLKLLRASMPTTIEIRQNLQSEETAQADPIQIHQLLMNLCTNAAHAMPNGGVLTVNLEDSALRSDDIKAFPDIKPGLYIKLSVSDTGHGMEPDVLNRIFDPFFTTKNKEEGTGLGLSVVHGIVKSHGGTITVQSEPDKGTVFIILLPAIEKRTQLKEEIEKPLPRGTETILYVDDEVALAKMAKKLIESLGYEVVTMTSSVDAIELFESNPDEFDLIITDMTMPKMTGDKLAEEMLRIKPGIPIILCSGFSSNIDKDRAMAMGIRAFIFKPILKRDIAEAIRMVLN